MDDNIKKEQKSVTVAYRVSPEDKQRVQKLANSYSLNPSELFRRMVDYIEKELPPLPDVALPNPN